MTRAPDAIAEIAGGRWIGPAPRTVRGASIDTRTLSPGNAFFALRGERTDGHAHLRAAHDAGAAFGVIDDLDAAGLAGPLPLLLVEDVRRALGALARAHRDTLDATVVGVTGSVGKTTTVRLIDAALSSALRGSASKRSFNNDLGVPLTLLNADPRDAYLVCEIGTNGPGEIDALGAIVRPDLCVLTGAGRAHLAGFGSVEGVAREKASLAAHLRPGGGALACADSRPLLDALPTGLDLTTYGRGASAHIRVVDAAHDGGGLRVTLGDGVRFTLALPGVHNAVNGAAAIGVARALGLPDTPVIDALARARPPTGRLQAQTLPADPPVTLIDDAYNANPESMLGALATLCDLGAGSRRRVAIIGDMLELGTQTEAAHTEVVRRAHDLPIEVIAGVGPHTSEALDALGARGTTIVRTVPDPSDGALHALADLVEPGDAVLVKASRALRLERAADAIRRRFAMAGSRSADNS
jgi:UDP-N-acetylmuramoyl-tripeptide--D-alanyl-D-alanine ligase